MSRVLELQRPARAADDRAVPSAREHLTTLTLFGRLLAAEVERTAR